MDGIKHLELLIQSQEWQESNGNLTKSGIEYLNGLRKAYRLIKPKGEKPVKKSDLPVFSKKDMLNFVYYCRNEISLSAWASQTPNQHFNDWKKVEKDKAKEAGKKKTK